MVKFASDLMDQPLKVLCELGGWKTAKKEPVSLVIARDTNPRAHAVTSGLGRIWQRVLIRPRR